MSTFSATLWNGTLLANVRYQFYAIDGTASAAEQSSGIAQNASGRPVFPIACTVPAGAVTMEVYDNSQADNWAVIALNFARGDKDGTIADLTTALAALVNVQAAVYDSATVSGDTITLSNGHTISKTGGNRVTT